MSLVLDASVTLSWYFEDEVTPAADAVLDEVRENGAVVPPLWRLEVANAFQVAIRRKRVESAYRDSALAGLGALRIAIDRDGDGRVWSDALSLADRFDLTVYAAAYLELAARLTLPLATRDRRLVMAAQGIGVAAKGFD